MRMGNQKEFNFQDWIEEKTSLLTDIELPSETEVLGFSLSSQINSLQENATNQLSALAGVLPEAGPLSAAFRARVMNAIYLLMGSIAFFILAIIIGLPTLLVRPTKFVFCFTISTLLATSSVIVLQGPTVFFSSILQDPIKGAPLGTLLVSLLFTLYATIFIRTYIIVIISGGAQVLMLLYYLASFIPGGSTGLTVLLRTGYTLASAALTPCLYICKKTTTSAIQRVFS